MNRFLLLLIGLALLAALMYHCLTTRPEAIQADVLACSTGQLSAGEFDRVDVGIDGRDVTLTGFVDDADTASRAEDLVLSNCGARVVDNQLVAAPAGPYLSSACIDHDGVTLSGAVPDAAARDRFIEIVHDRVGENHVTGDYELKAGARDGFVPVLSIAISELAQLDHGCVEASDGSLLVRGEVRSAEAHDKVVREVDAAATGFFDITYDLTYPQLSDMAQVCQDAIDEVTSPGDRVFFDVDSSDLHEEGRALLDHIEELSEQCPGISLIVAGHTDSTASASYNRDLSLRRANAVTEYLVEKGFGAERLTAVGYGESQPRESNDTEEGRAANRRIEFRVRENP